MEKTDNTEKEILNFDELRGTVTSGYTVSGQYSSRKIENRTSFEYPLSLNNTIVMALQEIQQIQVTHSSAKPALDAQFITEEEFDRIMIPTFFSFKDVAEKIRELNTKDKTEKILTEIDYFYLKKVVAYSLEIKNNFTEYDIKDKATNLMNSEQ